MAAKEAYLNETDTLFGSDGSTYHLGAREGDIAQRILTMGPDYRAKTIAALFDADQPVREIHSHRGMHTYTGTYKRTPISVIAIGMGAPMMDFMIREASQCQRGPLVVVRLGTCGLLNARIPPGTVMTAGKGSCYSYVNYGYWAGGHVGVDYEANPKIPYFLSRPLFGDMELNNALIANLKLQNCPTYDGVNACGETFYACQGRKDENFDDKNTEVINMLNAAEVDWLDMETHQLFHLATRRMTACKVASCGISVVNRFNLELSQITAKQIKDLEVQAGRACLETLAASDINSE